MKKSIIKLISAVISIIILTANFTTICVAYDYVPVIEYIDNGNGTCTITEFIDYSDHIVIPTKIDNLLVTRIGSDTFADNTGIRRVSIPLSVTEIDDYAFFGCDNLEYVSVTRVNRIGKMAFACCGSLKKIVIPETVTILEDDAYSVTDPENGVNIVNTGLVIHEDAFRDCENLTIYGYADSTAVAFARENGYKFKNLDPEIMYADININQWWYHAVRFTTAYDLISGKMENNQNKFKPADNITRAEAMTILWGFEGRPIGYETNFTDINPNNWCYEQIAWAHAEEISNGTTETTFSPNNIVTKAQLITFIYNYAKSKDYNINTEGYTVPSSMTDYNSVPNYAKEAVKWAAKNNIISTTGAFSPNSNATRAIAATTIHLFMTYVDC